MSRREKLSIKRVVGDAPAMPLLILFGLNAVDELDRLAFAILTPEIRDAFDLDNEGILSVIALVGIFALGGQVLIGYYADRFSRVRIATVGAAIWTVFTFITGIVPTVALLIIARCFTAIGKAVNDPTHNSLLADYYPPERRVGVYGVHRGANSLGQMLGPILGAGIAAAFGTWRAPFLAFWIPSAILVAFAAFKLTDPIRGRFERQSMGASEESIDTEEESPSFAEAWRICYQVKTLRRIWYSLPFFAAVVFGLGSITAIFYEELFDASVLQRGFIAAGTEPFQIVGLFIGVPIAARLGRRGPGLVLRYVAAVDCIVAAMVVGFALAPNLPTAIVMNILLAAPAATLVPGIYAVLSLAIPPRARALGFAIGSLYIIPGLVVLPIIGSLADDVGPRQAVLFLVPVLLIGAAIIGSAGAFVESDIDKVRSSTVAQADVLNARRNGEAKLLLVKGLDVAYGNVQVLFGVDFEIDEGEIVALLGTNGAGKSTLLKAISGLVEPAAGATIFDGRDMTHASPHEIAARGVIQVPGGKGVFPSLTVAENLKIAGWLYQKDEAYLAEATEKVLEFFPVLRERWNQQAGNMSGGEQQMLTLGQAFIAKPRLLMIDELSLGLAPVIVEQLLEIVRAIRDQGTTVIVVEQSINVALTLAETAYFMEKGEIRFNGPTAELLERPEILRSVFLQGAGSIDQPAGEVDELLDGDHDERNQDTDFSEVFGALDVSGPPPAIDRSGEPILSVREIGVSFGGVKAVNGVSFDLHRGEILGIIGPNGAGKTTLFDLISGYLEPSSGRVLLDGLDVTGIPADGRPGSASAARSRMPASSLPSP